MHSIVRNENKFQLLFLTFVFATYAHVRRHFLHKMTNTFSDRWVGSNFPPIYRDAETAEKSVLKCVTGFESICFEKTYPMSAATNLKSHLYYSHCCLYTRRIHSQNQILNPLQWKNQVIHSLSLAIL